MMWWIIGGALLAAVALVIWLTRRKRVARLKIVVE